MAQARRVSRSGRPNQDAVLLAGSYNFEQKVTVEWETSLAPDEFDALLAPIFTDPRTFAEIRTYVSSALKRQDTTLPAGKISKYQVSGRSLREALARMVSVGRLTSDERPGSHLQMWSRIPR